jgi:hypothetical protein
MEHPAGQAAGGISITPAKLEGNGISKPSSRMPWI